MGHGIRKDQKRARILLKNANLHVIPPSVETMGVAGCVEVVPPDSSANKDNVRKGNVRPTARVSPAGMMDVVPSVASVTRE